MASYDDTATVSGSIVRVNDGADSVGLKNWLVTLPASLDGYTEVNGTKSGANLFDGELENGWIGNDGSESPTAGRTRSKNYSKCKGNVSYYVTCSDNWRVVFYDSTKTFISYVGTYSSNRSITSPSNAVYFRFAIIAETPSSVGLNYPSTETSAQTPKAPTQYTASLGRTIYGGTADIVTGEAKPTNLFNAYATDTTNGYILYYYLLNTGETYYNSAWSTSEYISVKENFQYTLSGIIGGNPSICFYDKNKSFLSGVKYGNASPKTVTSPTGAVYARVSFENSLKDVWQLEEGSIATAYSPYFAPFTFTPVSIETSKGSNTFWSDQGDSEVTYYKDGYGTTSVTIHKETPDGEPVEETRKLHRIIYEGQVDVISGTGLIYRGESGTQYDPPEQISFTPIEIATDEGENTLYADEGDSSITYRKAVE